MTSSLRHFRIEAGDAGVVTVWIDAAERPVNVVGEPALGELEAVVEQLGREPASAVVMFRSAKEKGFLAGADLKRLAAITSAREAEEFFRRGQDVLNRLEALPAVTVAAIHGAALGGGLEFALACRLRIAEQAATTRLGLPETNLGLLPAWGGTQRLPRVTGLNAALRLLLTGEPVDAAAALEIGLVDAVCNRSEFESVASRLAGGVGSYGKRRSSLRERLRRHTSLGRSRALAAARRVWCPEGATEAQEAVLFAVAAGLRGGRDAGLQAEREQGARLLFTAECRRQLDRFQGKG
jgi:3-hydroxyacyl-CoA dehydrogenase/enoyl-CoA hydratase/3-hydroxybutyryl-CoA epimerase